MDNLDNLDPWHWRGRIPSDGTLYDKLLEAAHRLLTAHPVHQPLATSKLKKTIKECEIYRQRRALQNRRRCKFKFDVEVSNLEKKHEYIKACREKEREKNGEKKYVPRTQIFI